MLDRLSQRERILIIALIFFVILALYYFFIYQPIIIKIEEYSNMQDMNGKEFTNTISIIKKIPELKSKYEEIKYIEDIIIDRNYCSAENILKIIEEKADMNHIKTVSFIPSDIEDGIQLDIIFNGEYKNYINFLDKLKILENKVEFKTLQMQINNQELILNIKLLCNDISNDKGDT